MMKKICTKQILFWLIGSLVASYTVRAVTLRKRLAAQNMYYHIHSKVLFYQLRPASLLLAAQQHNALQFEQFATYWMDAAQEAKEKGDFDTAIVYYKKVIKNNSYGVDVRVSACFDLARLYKIWLHMPYRALPWYQRVLRIEGAHPEKCSAAQRFIAEINKQHVGGPRSRRVAAAL